MLKIVTEIHRYTHDKIKIPHLLKPEVLFSQVFFHIETTIPISPVACKNIHAT